MRPRTYIVLPLAALLGAGVAALSSMSSAASPAASPTATVIGTETIMWSPMEVTIAAGGTVTFSDPSKRVPHGVVWQSGPETPSCSGVPVGSGATDWTGTCTFASAGDYHYYCYVHGTVMSGVIRVEGGGPPATTSTGTAGGGETPGSGYAGGERTAAGGETSPASAGAGAGGTAGDTSTAPRSSAAPQDSLGAAALTLRARQHREVRGSLRVAQQGSTLRVTLLLSRSELGAHPHTSLVAGRLQQSGLPAGEVDFAVALDARARSALTRLGKLELRALITLTPPRGASLRRTLAVELTR